MGPVQRPTRTGRAERQYSRSLRDLAKHVGTLVNSFLPITASAVPTLTQLLESYAATIFPWAQATAVRMLGEVDQRNRESWRSLGERLGGQLRQDLEHAPIGERLRVLLSEQVDLIRSLPTEAAQRIHVLTVQGLEGSQRAAAVQYEIERTSEVTQSRAVMIARTEVARTASVLTQTRAEAIGSTHYIWRTAHDASVRPGHKAMEGKTCEWAKPPAVVENGKVMYHHPGQIWNCRCYPEPVLDLA